jgi:Tfp pilus assembly protein PilV
MKSITSQIKRLDLSAGFSLIEVSCGMLISILAVSVTANLMVTANIYKIKAKKNAQMTALIQSDVELIKSQANLLPYDQLKCSATASNGYAKALSATFSSSESTATLVNDSYTVTRTLNPITDPNILPLSYRVKRTGSTSTEYSIYIEVVPNAIFQCPSI